MKKAYTKPVLLVESFELTQSIASCGALHNSLGQPAHSTRSDCGWDLGFGDVIWVEGTVCSIPWDKETPISGVCYNNPDGGNNIFMS